MAGQRERQISKSIDSQSLFPEDLA